MALGNNQSAIDAYRTSSIENAPGIKIVRLLYDGALRFLDRALACGIEDPKFGAWVMQADAIVLELRLSIRPEHAPEVMASLEELYLFCEERHAKAILEKDPTHVQESREVLSTLLEAWQQIELEGKGVGA